MFSARLAWETEQNPLTLLLQKKRKEGIRLLDLTVSNPTQVGLFSKAAQTELLIALQAKQNVDYHPHPQGVPEARKAIADYYQSRHLTIDQNHLLLCASTSEAYSFLFQLLTNPGDTILSPQPSYPLFEHLAGLANIKQNPYFLDYHERWWLDIHSLEQNLTTTTKAVMVVHPNNPTGSFINRQEAETLFSFCEKHQLALIVDEVFGDYAFHPDPTRFSSFIELAASRNILCFVLSGISKVLGLPQLKLSWIYTLGPESLRNQAQHYLELISDTFLSVSTPTQWAITKLLPQRALFQEPIQQRLATNVAILRQQTEHTLCQPLLTEGGFSAIVKLPKLLTEEEWVLLFLQQENLLCHPGYFFDFSSEPYVVLSLLPTPEVFLEGVCRMISRVKQVAS